MKRLMLVALAVCLCVSAVAPGVWAFHETFKYWGSTNVVGGSTTPGFKPGNTYITESKLYLNETTGALETFRTNAGSFISNANPSLVSYIAYDLDTVSGSTPLIQLYDSDSTTLLQTRNIFQVVPSSVIKGRVEVDIIGGSPSYYYNGIYNGTGATLARNPSYFREVAYSINVQMSNIVYGETDHHIISSIPYNWSIVKDLINPSAIGVYAYSPSTKQFDTVKNSNYFYIDADTDSTDDITTENLIILNEQGTAINTTAIDSTVPHHIIAYYLEDLLTEANGHYGRFSVHFENSEVYDYFDVIATGATISFDSDDYTVLDEAVMSYTVTPGYWDTSTYDYSILVMSGTTGATLQSTPISSSTGSATYVFKDTDTTGAVYAAVVATPKTPAGSNGIWMTYDYAEYHQYSTFDGYVNDAETGLPITGANVTITQNDVFYSLDATDATGFYDSSGTNFVSGMQLNFNVTAVGHEQYYANIIPASETSIRTNITLNATTITAYTGLGIGGVIRDGASDGTNITTGYGRPVSAATVTATNASDGLTCTTTSNIAGWYMFSNTNGCYLQQDHIYAINASKLRFTDSTIYNVQAHGALA